MFPLPLAALAPVAFAALLAAALASAIRATKPRPAPERHEPVAEPLRPAA